MTELQAAIFGAPSASAEPVLVLAQYFSRHPLRQEPTQPAAVTRKIAAHGAAVSVSAAIPAATFSP
jgi:hypothetical protein